VIPDRDTDPAPAPIRLQGFEDRNWKKKNTDEKSFIFFEQKFQLTYRQRTSKPQEKPLALKREHSALQKRHFCG
jgi:hypothetical protein